jgi:hypothetical protein
MKTISKKKKILFIQLNELNLELVQKYSNNINFKFFNKNFFEKLLVTDSETNYDLLEPWIQWASVYTGKTAKEHNIFRLGDIEKYNGTSMFNVIEELNKSVGIICSMNLKNNLKKPKYFLSDPWTKTLSGPSKIIQFISNTISKAVNMNSHSSMSITLYFRILAVLLITFRFKNIFLYLKLIFNIKKKWNKALLLDLILHDLHLNLIKKHKTDFSCIFLNAGAHIQHHYFLNSKYSNNKGLKNPEWYVEKKHDPLLDAIFFYDNILSDYRTLNDYELVLATGLSQKPYDRLKFYYRLKDHGDFLKKLDINFLKVEPRMTRDFLISFNNKEEKKQAIKKLKNFNDINKLEIFSLEDRDNSIFVTLLLNRDINDYGEIIIENQKNILFKDHVVFVALKNGMHEAKGYFYSNFNTNIKNIFQINKEIIGFFNK